MLLVACVLFAGILGATNAQYNTPGRTGMGTIPEFKMTEMLNRSCLDNGGYPALDSFAKANKNLQQCLSSTFAELAEDMKRNVASSKPLESTLNLFCTKITKLEKCATTLVDSMKACNKPEMREDFDTAYRVLARTLDFICDNKEKIAEAVTTSGEDQCTAKKGEAVKECMRQIIPASNAAGISADIEAMHNSIPSLSIDEKECRDLETAEKCIVRELSVCDNKIVAELVTSMFESINTELPCGKFDLSPASPVSVVSIALLTAALAVSL